MNRNAKSILYLLATFGTLAHAQEAGSPISSRIVHDSASLERSLALTNSSAQPVKGYVAAIEFLRNGNVAMRHVFSGGRYDEKLWLPGESVESRKVTAPVGASGAPLPARVVVDLVVFADDSTWGPRKLNSSARLLGQLEGQRMYRDRLRGMMEKQGVGEVVRELSKPSR